MSIGKFDGILLLTDIDGTLTYDRKLSRENKRAIEYFQANGGLFSYSTGRALHYLTKYPLTPNAPIICVNGTLICNEKTGEVIKSYPMTDNFLVVPKFVLNNYRVQKMTCFTETEDFAFEEPTEAILAQIPNKVNKFVFIFDDETLTLEVKNELINRFSQYSFERSWRVGLEMHAKNSGKGVCIKEIKKLTNSKYVVSAGDYENDESMLLEADISYATANAAESTKKAADYVTVSCEEHAIAQIIKEIEEKGTSKLCLRK